MFDLRTSFECGGGFARPSGKGKLTPLSGDRHPNPVKTTDPTWLYWEAELWDGIDEHKALDTMRLFVERYPHDNYASDGIGKTNDFVNQIANTGKEILQGPWIDQYNWLTSIYSLDTTADFTSEVITDMSQCALNFDRNLAANIMYNYMLLFREAGDISFASQCIGEIRKDQKLRGEDTAAWWVMPIPPKPFGSGVVGVTAPPSLVNLSVIPNPADKSLAAFVEAPFAAPATLAIYDALGREVERLPESRLQMGHNRLDFDCTSLPAGSYYLRLSTGGTVKTVRVAIEH